MNNEQFRRLLVDTPRQQNGTGSTPNSRSSSTPSRSRPSVLFTPRQVGGSSVKHDFARQLAERDAANRPTKKFKSSAPKGSKLAAGYRDRTQDRIDDEDDEKAKRINALEEAMKLGQIDRETYDRLTGEIAGGDINSTHLVKGLDWKLLERVRRGEDVFNAQSKKDEPEPDVEGEFEQLESKDIVSVVKEKAEKKGEMAPPKAKPLSRNAILAELKASRKAAAEAAEAERRAKYPALGPGFRKIGESRESSRLEIDEKGREVLIITDAQGHEKRKIRKQKVETAPELPQAKPLDHGLKIPEPPPPPPAAEPEEEEDDDIFEGVGANYNPLAELGSSDDSSSEGEEEEVPPSKKTKTTPSKQDAASPPSRSPSPSIKDKESMPPPTLPKRDWFGDTSSKRGKDSASDKPVADATVMAALRKVRSMDPESELLQTEEEVRLKKRVAQLAAADRDMEDIDMGFGSSRFDDAEEMEDDERVKLAQWKGSGANEDDEEDGGKGGGGKKRKRGPKKRKGDKNSASDVLKVMERNKEKTLG